LVGTLYFACFYLVGALLALASGKAERGQVHPLKITKTKTEALLSLRFYYHRRIRTTTIFPLSGLRKLSCSNINKNGDSKEPPFKLS